MILSLSNNHLVIAFITIHDIRRSIFCKEKITIDNFNTKNLSPHTESLMSMNVELIAF